MISQLHKINKAMIITKEFDQELQVKFAAKTLLIHKLKLLQKAASPLNNADHVHSENTFAKFLFDQSRNISTHYKKLVLASSSVDIRIPTRVRDGKDVVDVNNFKRAYLVIKNKNLTNKTKENSIQTLNRSIWTNNKAFKYNMRDNPDCQYCGEIETMEHMYC